MTIKLTDRQQQILDMIRQAVIRTGFPPTRAEIAKSLGFRSANAAEDHLRALARKGVIELTAGASRGIRLTELAAEFFLDAHDPLSTHSMDTLPSNVMSANQSDTDTSHTDSVYSSTNSSGLGTEKLGTNLAGNLAGGRIKLKNLPDIGQVLVPLIGRVAAGYPMLAAENIEKEISVDPNLFQQAPDYLLKVKGLSMKDVGILDGDLLAIKKTSDARNGQIIVARIDDEVTVKRLHKNGKHIELLPENSDFEPIVIQPGQDFSVEGIALGLIRNTPLH